MSDVTSFAGRPTPATIHEAAAALAEGSLSSQSLCESLLARHREVDGTVRSFVAIDEASVLANAAASDARRAAGEPLSAYDGIPVSVKDNISVAGQGCGCASKILAGYEATYDSTVAARLKAHGMICFGRTNMDEFAMGSTTEHSSYQPTRNPCHIEHVPGGSSGGSAAAVASGQTMAALGSDTGGSIRQPGSFCGVVGFKPSYGRVSRFGLVAFASSLDQIGPIASDVRDAAIMLDVIGGHDAKDSTSIPEPCGGFEALVANGDLNGLTVGLPTEFVNVEGLSDGVRAGVERAIAALKDAGCRVVDVSLPSTRYGVAAYYVIATAEASSNLSRFDGIRYGARADTEALLDTYLETRAQGFGEEVKRRIILGTYVLSSGYYDAYYLRAQKVRTIMREDYSRAFAECDVILSPVAPTSAMRFGAHSDPLEMYLSDIYTIPVNLTGNCAISVPFTKDHNGMPIGVQLIGPTLGEGAVLRAAELLYRRREEG